MEKYVNVILEEILLNFTFCFQEKEFKKKAISLKIPMKKQVNLIVEENTTYFTRREGGILSLKISYEKLSKCNF